MAYVKKIGRGSYGFDKLQEDVEKVRKGEMSKRKVEALYGVKSKNWHE